MRSKTNKETGFEKFAEGYSPKQYHLGWPNAQIVLEAFTL